MYLPLSSKPQTRVKRFFYTDRVIIQLRRRAGGLWGGNSGVDSIFERVLKIFRGTSVPPTTNMGLPLCKVQWSWISYKRNVEFTFGRYSHKILNSFYLLDIMTMLVVEYLNDNIYLCILFHNFTWKFSSQEMERSADVLAAGLLEVADPSLSSKFFLRQVCQKLLNFSLLCGMSKGNYIWPFLMDFLLSFNIEVHSVFQAFVPSYLYCCKMYFASHSTGWMNLRGQVIPY